MKSVPLDVDLYEEVKAEAKQRFAVWPSAYASGWLVKEYKRRGGRYVVRSNPSLRWHLKNEDVAEMLIGLLEQTGRTEDLLAILAEYYEDRAEIEKHPDLREALEDTAEILSHASLKIEQIFDNLG
jgi:hypothetical protein